MEKLVMFSISDLVKGRGPDKTKRKQRADQRPDVDKFDEMLKRKGRQLYNNKGQILDENGKIKRIKKEKYVIKGK